MGDWMFHLKHRPTTSNPVPTGMSPASGNGRPAISSSDDSLAREASVDAGLMALEECWKCQVAVTVPFHLNLTAPSVLKVDTNLWRLSDLLCSRIESPTQLPGAELRVPQRDRTLDGNHRQREGLGCIKRSPPAVSTRSAQPRRPGTSLGWRHRAQCPASSDLGYT
jgi:hypothetical protein